MTMLIGVSALPIKSGAVDMQSLQTGYCELTGSVTTAKPNCGGTIIRFSGPSLMGYGVDTGPYTLVFLGAFAGQNSEGTRAVYNFTELTKLFPDGSKQTIDAAGDCTVISDGSSESAVTCRAFSDQWEVHLQAEVPN